MTVTPLKQQCLKNPYLTNTSMSIDWLLVMVTTHAKRLITTQDTAVAYSLRLHSFLFCFLVSRCLDVLLKGFPGLL